MALVGAFPSYSLTGGLGLLLVHWWGWRVAPCYLLSAAALDLGGILSYDRSEWMRLCMEAAGLLLSHGLFHRKEPGKCWLPDLRQSLRFVLSALLLPYGLTRLFGLPLIHWFGPEGSRADFFTLVQHDLFSLGGAFFLVTLPGLLLLTAPMERAGWTRVTGATHRIAVAKCSLGQVSPRRYLPFFAYTLLIPIAVPLTTAWYFAMLIPLWAAIAHTPIAVSLAMAWCLPVSHAATRFLHGHPPSGIEAPEILTAASIGLTAMGLVSFLLAASLQEHRDDAWLKKQRNSELKESLATLLRALLSSPEATVISRFSDGKVVDANPAITKVLGYAREEILGMRSESLNLWVRATDRQHWVAALLRPEGVQAYETELRHKSGETLPCIISARLFPLDNQTCVIATLRLNRATKEMEKELERSRTLYGEAQRIAHMGHWELHIPSGDLLWSDEIYRIFEVNPDTHTPSYALFLSLIHPDDRERVGGEFTASLCNHTPYETTHRLILADDRVKYVHERGHTEYDTSGNPMRTIGTVQDVTPYKEMEMEKEKTLMQLRQSQKLESIGTLAGGIAHDFNNILSAILGYAEISLSPLPDDPQLVANIQQILDAGNRARELVRQLLTFCRKTKQTREPITVKPLIKETIKFLHASLPATIQITEQLDSDALILGDPTQIHQVIMNLCTNAAHAMRNHGGVLSIELSETTIDKGFTQRFVEMTSGRYLKLIVGDTGHGMPPETRERIFDPFFTTKKEGEGTGLGLSVVHGIVTSHGGQILVYSEPGLGTSFALFFPIVTEMGAAVPDDPVPLPQGTERLLVVDDEPPLVALMKLMLTPLGYTVTAATCPAKALALFQATPDLFDALITDMTMPSMTGVDLIDKVRALRKGFPVILCSGFSENLSHPMGTRHHPVKTLIKPLDRRTIATALRDVLDPSGKNDAARDPAEE